MSIFNRYQAGRGLKASKTEFRKEVNKGRHLLKQKADYDGTPITQRQALARVGFYV